MNIAVHTVGRLKALPGEPEVAGFVDNIPAVFSVAERSDGFIWRFNRLTNPEHRAEFEAYVGDAALAVTLSVWESVEKLNHYVFKTLHGRFYDRKDEWFHPPGEAMFVLWRVPEGHEPTLAEAGSRLAHLRTHGPSDHAFDWTYGDGPR
jgi:hypothetical protein